MNVEAVLSQVKPEAALGYAVAGYSVYNAAVIQWELSKDDSTVCAKCARTRQVIGLALGLFGLWVAVGRGR